MGLEDCYLIGQILKSHGVQGAMAVELFPSSTGFIKDMESVFVEIHQKPVPFFINKFSFSTPDSAIIQFDDVDSIDAARQLVNCRLYALTSQVPPKIRNEFRSRDLVGFLLVDETAGEIGPVTAVSENAGQVLLQIDRDGEELLVPLHADIVQKVDRKRKRLHLSLPEGLLDLYRGN